ncbi:hypothetical protein VKT23_007783 [Stygiomarasmius scandens]|uniref:Methyltransferase domain-containing protein n=1 Tax=Marasmiellus scandens TaxID=2682957 RepID=A0ABR1JIE3_9AGAR
MDTTQPVQLKLNPDEEEFFLLQTGIESVDDLKEHILDIQRDALKIVPYDLDRLKMSKLPWYNQVLQSMKINESTIFLDMACCLGTDIRKAIADGFPAERIIASDICQEFWNLGHKLFRTNPEEIFPKFFCGDVLDTSFIPDILQSNTSQEVPSEQDKMASFAGHVKIIHASNLFHLFNEADQTTVAERLAVLVSHSPGSIIFGSQVGRHEKGYREEAIAPPANAGYLGNKTFCHSVSSWTEMWHGIFPAGSIRVDADLVERSKEDLVGLEPGVKLYQIMWCVTVL